MGERQRVEILKVLYRGARVLIMDEPTAVLAPQEVDDLFRTLRSMTAAGRSIVFISHKLGEVLAIADRITVMRRGRVTAAALPAAGVTKSQLATLMVGRTLLESHGRAPTPAGDTVLALENVEADSDKGTPALRGVTLEVRAGEILGIAAVAGNGQSELAEVVTGLRPCRGRVLVGGAGRRQPVRPHDDRPRRGPRARGPQRGRQRAEPVARRQPDHEALPGQAHRARPGDRQWGRAGGRERAQGALRDLGAVRSTPRSGSSRAATSSG